MMDDTDRQLIGVLFEQVRENQARIEEKLDRLMENMKPETLAKAIVNAPIGLETAGIPMPPVEILKKDQTKFVPIERLTQIPVPKEEIHDAEEEAKKQDLKTKW